MATDQPDADRRRAAGALGGVQRYAPLDLVVELVEARYSERRSRDRRWFTGLAVALVSVFLASATFLVTRVRETNQRVADVEAGNIAIAQRGGAGRDALVDFPRSPTAIGTEAEALDDAARGVLQEGPSELGGVSVGDVFYVDAWRWIDVVFPEGGRDDPDATCGIRPPGELTVPRLQYGSRRARGIHDLWRDIWYTL